MLSLKRHASLLAGKTEEEPEKHNPADAKGVWPPVIRLIVPTTLTMCVSSGIFNRPAGNAGAEAAT